VSQRGAERNYFTTEGTSHSSSVCSVISVVGSPYFFAKLRLTQRPLYLYPHGAAVLRRRGMNSNEASAAPIVTASAPNVRRLRDARSSSVWC
jgi:hypothetical protein